MKYILLGLGLACIIGGCGNSGGPPLDANQEKQASQLDEIAKRSGGDWDKLSDADKKAMIQIGGSEQGAKMLLLGKSGKLGRHGPPGGPGGPGGPKPGGG
jgi:hypothetical protein